jgi:hypothetical protein
MRATMTITGRLCLSAACLLAVATASFAGANTAAEPPSDNTQFSAVEATIRATLSTQASAAFGGTNVTPDGDFVIHVVGCAASMRVVKALVPHALASLPADERPIPLPHVTYVPAHLSLALATMMQDESLITQHRDALAALGVQVTS